MSAIQLSLYWSVFLSTHLSTHLCSCALLPIKRERRLSFFLKTRKYHRIFLIHVIIIVVSVFQTFFLCISLCEKNKDNDLLFRIIVSFTSIVQGRSYFIHQHLYYICRGRDIIFLIYSLLLLVHFRQLVSLAKASE